MSARNNNQQQAVLISGNNRPYYRINSQMSQENSQQLAETEVTSNLTNTAPPDSKDIFSDESNLRERIKTILRTHYNAALMLHQDNPDAFLICMDERQIAKCPVGGGARVQSEWKAMKSLKNQCSKLMLALTKMSDCN